MSSEPNYPIFSLTFLHTYQFTGLTVTGPGQDVSFTTPPDDSRSGVLSRFGRAAAYHLSTSGYGLHIDGMMRGWMYLRGWRQMLYIDTLLIAPDWHHHDLEKQLLAVAEYQAVEQQRKWLGATIRQQDERMIQLCQDQGFSSVDEQFDQGELLPPVEIAPLARRLEQVVWMVKVLKQSEQESSLL